MIISTSYNLIESDIEKLFAEKRSLQKKDVEERLGRRLQGRSEDASCPEEERGTQKTVICIFDCNLKMLIKII